MSLLSRLSAWKRNLFHKGEVEESLDEELTAFVDLLSEEKQRAGMSPQEARRAALLETGGLDQLKEECRDGRALHWLDVLHQDLRYGLRLLLRNPGFAATVVLTLGLGIGATTAIFSVVHATLLRPLPYSHPESLVYVMHNLGGYGPMPFSRPLEFNAWRDRNHSLSQIAAYIDTRVNVVGVGEAQRMNCGIGTASFFQLLGTRPEAGRLFLPEEDKPGGAPVALLSYALWRGRFGGDPAAVGRTLTVDGKRYIVAGILPASFRVPDRYGFEYDLWLPFATTIQPEGVPPYLLRVVGRLAPGVTASAAQAELDSILQSTLRRPRKINALLVPWQQEIAGGVRTSLLVFLGAVGFLLLIACVNVAILLLSRAAAREREVAVRLALGAPRSRIIRQLLTESLMMALSGAAVGLVLAYWAKDLLVNFLSKNLPAMDPVQLDYRVLAFNLGLAVLTGLFFGLAPALATATMRDRDGLRESARGASESRVHYGFRNVLIVTQVATAITLTIGAGLLVKSFLRLRGLDMGFRSDRVLTLTVNLTPADYPDSARQIQFFQRALQNIQSLGGVESAAANYCLPLGNTRWSVGKLKVEGRPDPLDSTDMEVISTGYFHTMQIPWKVGRDFTEQDKSGSPSVAIVNETFARRFCPEGRCLGRRIEHWKDSSQWMTIVGVAGDTRASMERPVAPVLFVPYLQGDAASMTLVIRTSGEPMSIAAAVRAQLAAIDRRQPPSDVMSLDDLRGEWIAHRRASMLLLSAFALLALVLGSIGIYGVVAYNANRRTHEIGIRMALGARERDVLSLITRRTLVLIAMGELAGLGAALALNRVLKTLVVEIATTDTVTYAAACLLWTMVALLACYLPARRSARMEPMLALHCE
ncbi:ABC transporter permease [uncultured Paludibaculum sp.]|uniref:ABC transporter permease n=1 Tax=uncultured Paludibaculum sp. TaxID=1765020 RepID=UPI002AABAE7C|nr:ABC transporter permease [uncultured Paludibaculum sp.]